MNKNIFEQITNQNRVTMEEIEATKPIFKGKNKYKSVIVKGNNVYLIIQRFLRKYKYFKEPTWIAEIETSNKLIIMKRKMFNGRSYETYSFRAGRWDLYHKRKKIAFLTPTCFLIQWYPYICDGSGYGYNRGLGGFDTDKEAKVIAEKNLELWECIK